MKQERITLRCEDGAEAVVFTKYSFMSRECTLESFAIKDEVNYEIMFEDSYIGGDYKGFFGRIKRAWRAFWDKPVVYTGIYCEDKDKMKKFLTDCLNLVDSTVQIREREVYYASGSARDCDSVTSNEELIKKGEW